MAALLASPAAAHVSPRVRVASPEEGAVVYGTDIRVVLVAEGGDGPGLFTMSLDGALVDATGRVGGTFTTLSVLPNEQTAITVPMSEGEHELRVTQRPDPDSPEIPPVVVRRFRVVAEAPGGGAGLMLGLALLVVAGAVGAVVAVRRKAASST